METISSCFLAAQTDWRINSKSTSSFSVAVAFIRHFLWFYPRERGISCVCVCRPISDFYYKTDAADKKALTVCDVSIFPFKLSKLRSNYQEAFLCQNTCLGMKQVPQFCSHENESEMIKCICLRKLSQRLQTELLGMNLSEVKKIQRH